MFYDTTEVRLRKMASRRARRLVDKTDVDELTLDLIQEGWAAYLAAASFHDGVKWLNVQRAMNDYLCKWIYGTEYKQAKRNGFKEKGLVDLDVLPLANLDPTIEEQVYGMEIVRKLERAFNRNRNKLEAMFTAMVMSGEPRIARGLLPRFKLGRGGNPARVRRIREIFKGIHND